MALDQHSWVVAVAAAVDAVVDAAAATAVRASQLLPTLAPLAALQ